LEGFGFVTVRRAAFRALNRALAMGGLRLDRLALDFDDAPLDEFTLEAVFCALARAFEEWLSGQNLFEPREAFDTTGVVRDFYAEWRGLPFRERQGGSRFNNLLWLHLIAKAYAPDVIVDSGSFQGASAWALSQACPSARSLSFDIDLTQLKVRAAGVTYVQADWSTYPLATPAPDRMLCYFDDHVDQVRRIIEAAERGYGLAIFDDDYPVTSYYAMAPTPEVLPKLEFALNPSLADGQVLEWRSGSRELRWPVDRSYLDRGLAVMAATERLPNTSLITGIHQTPYRIVTIRTGGT
jgi:hypothetical protein